MVAFEQMRPHMDVDEMSMHLGYNSIIQLCCQHQQVECALALLQESKELAIGKGWSTSHLEAQLIPSLLAVAVQKEQTPLVLELAHRARVLFSESAEQRRKWDLEL